MSSFTTITNVGYTTHLKYHNLIGYGSNGGVYTLQNRFDLNLSHSQLSERLKRSEWRQSIGYKHKILVAASRINYIHWNLKLLNLDWVSQQYQRVVRSQSLNRCR